MTSPAASAFHRRFVFGLLAAALLSSLWWLTRHWNESLRDGHEGRQEQTALTAFYFKKDGLRLDYETPVLGPPWSIPMEFPLYQAIAATLSNLTGLPLEQAGRLTSVFFFYASLPAIWLLLRRHLPAALDRMLVIAYLAVCPLYLFYSGVFMIESTVLCLSLWFVLAFESVFARPWTWRLPVAWVLGALAATTKITTFVAVGSAAGALVIEQVMVRRRRGQPWSRALGLPAGISLLAVGVPLAAGVAWVRYADHLKAAHPYAHLLTSGSLREFNFGTLAQRVSVEWWRKIGASILTLILSLPGLLVLLGGLWAAPGPHRRLALVCLACSPAGLLLFANLYYVHDYYFYASAFFVPAALGVVVAGLFNHARVPRIVAAGLALVAFGGELYAFRQTYYVFYRHPNPPPPVEAAIIRAITPPEDVFAGFGFDWDCLWPYYAQRRGIMPFRSHFENFAAFDASLSHLGPRRLSTMFIARGNREDSRYIVALAQKLQMCPQPIARTEVMDIYVRRDLATAAVRALMAGPDWGAELNLQPDPGVVVLLEKHDLGPRDWTGLHAIASPLPLFSKGSHEIGFSVVDDRPVISTQAPAEIYFRPPPGSRSIAALGGMMPDSYTNGHMTPGVVLAIFEELADGTRHLLFERRLTPLTRSADRGDVLIACQQEKPFTGTLVFAHYAVPNGDVSYSWSYWKQISIY